MDAVTTISASCEGNEESSSRWSQVIGALIGTVTTDTEATGFDARHAYEIIGPVHFCRLSAAAHRVVRSTDPAPADGKGLVCINLQLDGESSFGQAGREVTTQPLEWTFFETSTPFTVVNHSRIEQLCLLLPREFLTIAPAKLQKLAVERFSGKEGIGRLFFQLAVSAFEEAPASYPALLSGLADGVIGLLTERLGRDENASLREAWRLKIKTYVVQHLDDPTLSIEAIATALRCTKRYLHSLFKDEDETLARFIWSLRLERCRMSLADPQQRDQSIAKIAYDWGFNSAPHFSQLFKDRFGESPRDYRTRLLSSDAHLPVIAA